MSIHITFDGLSGVDGSARFSFGTTTTALASVSGPIATRLATEHPARATVDVHVRPLSGVPGTAEKHVSTALRGILERACMLAQHPRTSVQVVVQALSPSGQPSRSRSAMYDDDDDDDDGTRVILLSLLLLAAEINACSLALVNAGSIPMRGVVCAVAVARPTNPSARPRIVSGKEGGGSGCGAAGCFAFLFGVDGAPDDDSDEDGGIPPAKMIWTNYRAGPGGAFSASTLEEAEEVALEGATAVWTKMKESIRASSFAGKDRLPQ